MTKTELSSLKKALILPGMQSHINRKKAAWKEKDPSQEILYTWVSHKLAQILYSRLMKLPLSQLLKMTQSGMDSLNL